MLLHAVGPSRAQNRMLELKRRKGEKKKDFFIFSLLISGNCPKFPLQGDPLRFTRKRKFKQTVCPRSQPHTRTHSPMDTQPRKALDTIKPGNWEREKK